MRPAPQLSAAPGAHRLVWNLRYARPRAIEYEYSIAAVFGEDTPTNVEGSFVLPGTYSVTLAAAGATLQAKLSVLMDPRVRTGPAGLQQLFDFSRRLDRSIEEVRTAHEARGSLRKQLEDLAAHLAGDAAHGALLQEATSLQQSLARPPSSPRPGTRLDQRAAGRIEGRCRVRRSGPYARPETGACVLLCGVRALDAGVARADRCAARFPQPASLGRQPGASSMTRRTGSSARRTPLAAGRDRQLYGIRNRRWNYLETAVSWRLGINGRTRLF